MKEALLYKKIDNHFVRCGLCAHQCTIKDGDLGICKVRKNQGGTLFSLSYDKVAAVHSDPIEKKPLYHFLPASISFSIATMGCNFSCQFCQNHTLSMVAGEEGIMGDPITPEQLVQAAINTQAKSIAYTYTEPTVFFELMLETAKLAQKNKIKNVMVTNGYMSEEALDMISPYMDAANVDLKAYSDHFYQKYCGARLSPVMENIKRMKERGIWVEVTTLLIPDLNTDEKELQSLISFILNIDDHMPWHVSRFFPNHQMRKTNATEPESIYGILEKAQAMGLKYLYSGNTSHDEWSNTKCPQCHTDLICRNGYYTQLEGIVNGKCKNCHSEVAGIWY